MNWVHDLVAAVQEGNRLSFPAHLASLKAAKLNSAGDSPAILSLLEALQIESVLAGGDEAAVLAVLECVSGWVELPLEWSSSKLRFPFSCVVRLVQGGFLKGQEMTVLCRKIATSCLKLGTTLPREDLFFFVSGLSVLLTKGGSTFWGVMGFLPKICALCDPLAVGAVLNSEGFVKVCVGALEAQGASLKVLRLFLSVLNALVLKYGSHFDPADVARMMGGAVKVYARALAASEPHVQQSCCQLCCRLLASSPPPQRALLLDALRASLPSSLAALLALATALQWPFPQGAGELRRCLDWVVEGVRAHAAQLGRDGGKHMHKVYLGVCALLCRLPLKQVDAFLFRHSLCPNLLANKLLCDAWGFVIRNNKQTLQLHYLRMFVKLCRSPKTARSPECRETFARYLRVVWRNSCKEAQNIFALELKDSPAISLLPFSPGCETLCRAVCSRFFAGLRGLGDPRCASLAPLSPCVAACSSPRPNPKYEALLRRYTAGGEMEGKKKFDMARVLAAFPLRSFDCFNGGEDFILSDLSLLRGYKEGATDLTNIASLARLFQRGFASKKWWVRVGALEWFRRFVTELSSVPINVLVAPQNVAAVSRFLTPGKKLSRSSMVCNSKMFCVAPDKQIREDRPKVNAVDMQRVAGLVESVLRETRTKEELQEVVKRLSSKLED